MIMDQQLVFSDGQAITATANSTNVIDGSVIRNLGVGGDLYVVMIVTVAFTDASSDSTVTPSLVTDDNAALSSVATVRTYDVFAALTAAGTVRVYQLDPRTKAGLYERYIALAYTVANGNLTTGSITAFLSLSAQLDRNYASGFSIS